MDDVQVQTKTKSNILPFVRTAEHFFNKGLLAYSKGNLSEARTYLQSAYELAPNEPLVIMQLAMLLTDAGEYETSVKALHRVLNELDPGLEECHYFLANNYALMEQPASALKHLKHYIYETDSIEFFEEAENLYELLISELADIDESLTKEEDLLHRQESITALMEKEAIPEAILLLEETLELYPDYWSGYNNLGMCYFYMGDVEEALNILREVCIRNRGNVYALCNIYIILKELHIEEDAEPILKMLKKLTPMNIDQCLKLAITFAWTAEYQLAYKWFKYCTPKITVIDSKYYFWYAKAAYHIGKEEEAQRLFIRQREEYPGSIGNLPPWEVDLPDESKK